LRVIKKKKHLSERVEVGFRFTFKFKLRVEGSGFTSASVLRWSAMLPRSSVGVRVDI